MKYEVQNISGGQLVCPLPSGNTLRLDVGEKIALPESDISDYLRTIEGKGYVRIVGIPEEAAESPAAPDEGESGETSVKSGKKSKK